MYEQAITEAKKALQSGGAPGEMRGLMGYAYAASGNRKEAERIIAELKSTPRAYTCRSGCGSGAFRLGR